MRRRALNLLFALLGAWLAAPAARAASFDCARAATAVEKAICGNATLSSLDERTIAAYAAAADTLGVGDDARDPFGDLLLKGHEQWTAARNRCGAATGCLLREYLRRLAVLEYKPDPEARSPLDRFVGRYGTPIDPMREMVVMAAPGSVVLVNLRVNAADWSCTFTGIGRAFRDGLRVVRPDFDGTAGGEHAILLTPTRLGLSVSNADPKDDVSARFCGAGGSLEQPFPRRE